MKQNCILISGMHRSGTSALAGTMNLLGVNLGSKLLKGAPENLYGFYENTHLLNFNEKLLKQMNSCWDDVFFNESKLNAIHDVNELESILRKEFQHSQVFAIKEPRLAYLLPLYIKALNNMNVNIKVIIPTRNPLEVAKSLTKRNKFTQEKGLLLWAYHFLYTEKFTRGLPRTFISFDELIKSPQMLIKQIEKKLMLNLNSEYDARKKQIVDLLTPSLKHHNISLRKKSEKVPQLIWNIMSLIPKLNEEKFDTEFDELRLQFFENRSLFYNDDILMVLQELEQAKEQIQATLKKLKQANEQIQAREKELEQANEQIQASMYSRAKNLFKKN